MSSLSFLFCWFLLSAFAFAPRVDGEANITINTATSKPTEWSADQIKTKLAGEVTTLSYTGHDGKHTSSVVPLLSVLKAAGVTTQLDPHPNKDPKIKHDELHYAVTVQGKDGYYVVLSIAELMSELGDRKAYLALDVDGKPWPEKETPMKLIMPDDQKPARWVHSVQSISVIKVEPPATQPAKE
jgi:hypothetical protein